MSTFDPRFGRRRFLKGLGGVTVGLPLLGYAGRASAQAMSGPRNVVLFWTPNGFNLSTFFPRLRHAGGSSAFGPLSAASFADRPLDLTPDVVNGVPREIFRHPEWGLRALAPLASKVSVLRGFRNSRRGFLDLAAGGDHGMNTACRFTAAGIGTGRGLALGPSLDYALAARINPLLDGARVPLVLHVGANANPQNGDGTSFISYRGSEDPDPGINNPWVAFRRLMGITPGGAAEDRLIRKRQRIADLVRGELGALQSERTYGARDRRLLTDWLGLIEATEDEMRETGLCTAETVARYAPVSAVQAFEGASNDALGRYEDFGRIGDLMLKITALSLVCGHTHVATIQWSSGAGGPAFGALGMGAGAPAGTWHGGERHHELSHRNGSDGAEPGFLPDVERNMSWIDQWYGERFRDLAQLLEELNLLDDTAMVWMPEFGDGRQHHFIDIAAVVAGGCGGYLKTGAVIDCSANGRWDDRLDTETNGPRIGPASDPANVYDLDIGWIDGTTSHNKLLTTLFNAALPRDAEGRTIDPIRRFPEVDTADPHNDLQDGEIDALKA